MFSDSLFKFRNFLFFGALLHVKTPSLFGFYVFFSVCSFHLVRENPNVLWIHCFYSLIVIFRNLFIIPVLGYSVIFKVNKKQRDFLSMNHEKNLVLFRETFFLENIQFVQNFHKWNEWIEGLTPSPSSLKKTSRVSFFTTCSWYCAYFIRSISKQFLLIMQENDKQLDHFIFMLKKKKKKEMG